MDKKLLKKQQNSQTANDKGVVSSSLIDMPSFSHMSDLGLTIMQKDCERFPEDKKFREAILIELGKRQKKVANLSGLESDTTCFLWLSV